MNLSPLESDKHGEMLIRLLKEYTPKVDQLAESLVSARVEWIASQREKSLGDTDFKYKRLSQLALRLQRLSDRSVRVTQHVSQYLSFAEVPDTIRVELEMRLADFESALESAVETAISSQVQYVD